MKKPLLIIISCLLTLGLVFKFYDKIIDGFYLYRITSPTSFHMKIHSYTTEENLASATLALDQPFYYLASGSQSFVFISADKQFILKFFKHYRWKPPLYVSCLPFFKDRWAQKRQDGLIATYRSCLFCMQEFKEETALLYIQLKPSDAINKTITLYNRLGKKYTIPLNTASFVLQKYAQPTSEHLLTLKNLKQHELAKEHIKDLFNNILKKRNKGFTDKDPNFLNNFGFVNNTAVSIDIGGIIKDPKKDNFYFCNHELKKVVKTLLPWIKKHYPEVLPYTKELINEIKEQISENKQFS